LVAHDVIQYLAGSCDDTPECPAAVCLRELASTPNVWRLGCGIDQIRTFAKMHRIPEGDFIVRVLRAFHSGVSVARGMANVHELLASLSPSLGPSDPEILTIVFSAALQRGGVTGAAEFRLVLSYVSDAQVALSAWVDAWNRKRKKEWEKRQTLLAKLH